MTETGRDGRATSVLLNDYVGVRELSTPFGDLFLVPLGTIDHRCIAALKEMGYDEVAVRSDGSPTRWGLVEVSHLERLQADGVQLREGDAKIRYEESHLVVDAEGLVDLLYLLGRMRDHLSVLVMEQYVDEDGAMESIQGILTVSDLNRHALRGAVYRLLAMVEAGLATLLKKEFTEPWEWIKILNEEDQARVCGYWEVSKRKGVNIGPTAATTLVQLLKVFEKREFLAHLGISRPEFDHLKSGVPRVRNCVMHPVRPLVSGHSDVAHLHTIVAHLKILRAHLHKQGHIES
jgi:hypothetical protein